MKNENVQFTFYIYENVQFTFYIYENVQFTFYSLYLRKCTVYILQFTLYSLHFILRKWKSIYIWYLQNANVQFANANVQFANANENQLTFISMKMYSLHFTVYIYENVQFTFYSLCLRKCTVHIWQFTLYSLHFILRKWK